MQKFLRFGIAAQVPLYKFEISPSVLFKARTFDLFGLNTLPTTHIWTSLARKHPQDLFNAELFKLCPFIPELKLWVFWTPIFISTRKFSPYGSLELHKKVLY
jgi:hypothetical protein